MDSGLNIIIPMAGLGQRFQQEGYLSPKPLVKVLGTPILDKLLNCLDLNAGDTVYIPHLKYLETITFLNILTKYFRTVDVYDDFCNKKLSAYGKGKSACVVIELELPTHGASETLLIATKFMNKEIPLLSLDCDNIYSKCPLNLIRNMDKAAIFYFLDTQENPIYSYIQIQDEKIILIREKEKISDFACSGGYYFASTKTAIKYAEIAQKTWLYGTKEMYISNMYANMIADGEIIVPIKAIPQSFGIPMAVETYSKNNAEKNVETKIFCFDLDLTIISSPLLKGDYTTCIPNMEIINFIQYLYALGNHIIIHTARGMLTYAEDMQKIELAYRTAIEEMLKKYSVPYHRLIFGKPYADFYIDDKAVSTFSNFGRETGFYHVKNPPNMRNKLSVADGTYIKEGNLEGEYWWYTHINQTVHDMFLKILPGSNSSKIITQKINGITFSEKFLGGTLTITHLQALLHSLQRIHNSEENKTEIDIYANYLPKLEERMGNKHDTKLYKDIKSGLEKYEKSNSGVVSVIHGDTVFTNIFLTDTHTIKFIDMRGKVGNTLTIFGDKLYDYAKVYQSLTGYDAILHDKTIPHNMADLLVYFETVMKAQMKWIYLITASLYYTLIPLHSNETEKQISRYYGMAERLILRYSDC